MSQLEVTIKVDICATEAPSSASEEVERLEPGHFRLVLEGAKELDIDGLEQALLQVNYPALRDALSSHLEARAKKTRIANLAWGVSLFLTDYRFLSCSKTTFSGIETVFL